MFSRRLFAAIVVVISIFAFDPPSATAAVFSLKAVSRNGTAITPTNSVAARAGGGPVCGDAVCENPLETSCACPADCGTPLVNETGNCGNALDDDCDASVDCQDSDCAGDPACATGACCDPVAGACSVELNSICHNLGRLFFGAGTSCEAQTCTPNGCCDGSLSCEDVPYCDGAGCGPTASGDKFSVATDLGNGEFRWSATDLRIPGRGFDFVLSRTYRSRRGRTTVMGQQWDMSYNLFLRQDGPDLLFGNGEGRLDRFTPQGGGTWGRAEYFRIVKLEAGGHYTMTHADKTVWTFAPLNGAVSAGKITSIVDRNLNVMTFAYDALGRLVEVRDTLHVAMENERVIRFQYNADGFLQSVTDFKSPTPRVVTYTYYQNGDAGGAGGDLKTATSPPVTNASTGNNFPTGKTTTYTYTIGFANACRDHNLLAITDAKSQTYLTNSYSSSGNPADLTYDRVVGQNYDTGRYDFVYKTGLSPGAFNGAVAKTMVNNRAGDVKELFYDARNRLVIAREYTGRAASFSSPTDLDLNINPPGVPLRDDDPQFFRSEYDWNGDSLVTQSTYPNENIVDYVYDSGNSNPRARGTRTSVVQTPGILGGDQPQISESFAYGIDFYGCCGMDFVTNYIDGRGSATNYGHDARGNRTQITTPIPGAIESFAYSPNGQLTKHVHGDNGGGCRRVDLYNYYQPADGPQNGYLKEMIVDAVAPPDSCAGAHFSLTTKYEYDAVGNVIRTRDPKNQATDYEVNALNQVVKQESRQVAGSVRYETQTFYDANNNVVRVSVKDVNDAGVATGNTWHTINQYDALDNVEVTCRNDVPSGAIPDPPEAPTCDNATTQSFLRTTIAYDRNKNRSVTNSPEAVNGGPGPTVTRNQYDERDLIFRSIQGDVDPEKMEPDESTTQTDYDGNGQTKRTKEGLENNPRISTSTYDGYGRVKTSTDAMGNVRTYMYDGNGNLAHEVVNGALVDTMSDATGNVPLYDASYIYDALNRRTFSFVEHFVPGGANFGPSVSETQYTGTSQVERTTDDNNHSTLTFYDTANRVELTIDAALNQIEREYDANGNVVEVIEREVSDLGNPLQVFHTLHMYDELDRRTKTTDNQGNQQDFRYDSRGHRALSEDALGRETRYVYDGLSRMVKTVRDMDNNGALATTAPGDGNPDIVMAQSWDRNSRLESQTDDNDNTTVYSYDALDRRIGTVFADCTSQSVEYDVHGNVFESTDANQNVVTHTYDLLNRLTGKTVQRGPGVEGTLSETYQYDGLSRVVLAQDNDSLVLRDYDSFSSVTEDWQDGKIVGAVYDGVGNQTQLSYPGGRIVTTLYDSLNRKQNISDNFIGAVASYDYIGPSRVERKTLGNGTQTDYAYDGITGIPNPPNDFGVKRIIQTTHSFGATIIDDRTYRWDPVGNKTERKDVRAAGPQLKHVYNYDAADRLAFTDVRNAANAVVRQTDYDLDGVGNREVVIGSPDAGTYDMDGVLCTPPGDFSMNQYSATPFDVREYDANGNLVGIIHPLPPTWGNDVCSGGGQTGQPCSLNSECPGGFCSMKNRYISITPQNAGQQTVIQITAMTLPPSLNALVGDVWYANAPVVVNENPSPGPTMKAATLACGTGNLRDWAAEGLVHITGAIIVPGATYEVRQCTAVGGVCSNPPLVVGTNKYGDVVPPLVTLQPNFADISAMVAKFQAQPGAISKSRAQMQPNVLNPANNINFLDISAVVGAFQGQQYGFPAAGCPAVALTRAGGGTEAEIVYDYRNQMIRYTDGVTDRITEYAYDCFGRRFEKIVDVGGANETTRFVNDGWQEIEEQDGAGATLATYAFGLYIDEVLTMRRDLALSVASCLRGPALDAGRSQGSVADFFYHTDDMYNVMAVTDSGGLVAERYEYQDYGAPQFFDSFDLPVPGSQISNPLLFNGRRHDSETTWYFYRTRYLDPNAGRLSTRDTIGVWGDPTGLGNAYSFAGDNPMSSLDPFGQLKECRNCTNEQEQQIARAEAAAAEALIEAHRVFTEDWGNRPSNFNFSKCLRDVVAKNRNLYSKRFADAKNKYESGVVFIVHDEQKLSAVGDRAPVFADAPIGGSKINIYPEFFKLSAEEQRSKLIHEYGRLVGVDSAGLESDPEDTQNIFIWNYSVSTIRLFKEKRALREENRRKEAQAQRAQLEDEQRRSWPWEIRSNWKPEYGWYPNFNESQKRFQQSAFELRTKHGWKTTPEFWREYDEIYMRQYERLAPRN